MHIHPTRRYDARLKPLVDNITADSRIEYDKLTAIMEECDKVHRAPIDTDSMSLLSAGGDAGKEAAGGGGDNNSTGASPPSSHYSLNARPLKYTFNFHKYRTTYVRKARSIVGIAAGACAAGLRRKERRGEGR